MMTRTCVGCRRRGPKGSFVRVHRVPEGGVEIDPDGTAPGRGAYVCADGRCFEQAVRRGRLARALRTSIPDAAAGRLAEAFERSLEEHGRAGSEGAS